MKTVKIIKSLFVAVVLPLVASAATHRYIVELSTEPATNFAARSFGAHKESLSHPDVRAHRARIRAEQDAAATAIQALGGAVVGRTDTASNTLFVDMPEENAPKLASLPGVKGYHRARRAEPALDQALIVHKFPLAYSIVGGMANAGQGIKIAMIDSGIDITQPSFQDSGFTAPAGFPKVNSPADTKYTNNKVIVARSYVNLLVPSDTTAPADTDLGASDEVGHGTITSSVAAGGAVLAPVDQYFQSSEVSAVTLNGAAPGAYLGSYKVFGTPGTQSDTADNEAAILKAIDDAVNDGMDVINFSLGGFASLPGSQEPIATALNNAFNVNVLVTAAAGNDGEGLDPLVSYTSTDGYAATIPGLVSGDGGGNVIEVGASSNQRAYGASLTVGTTKYLLDREDAVNADANNNYLVFKNAPIVNITSVDSTGKACSPLPANSLAGVIVLLSLDGWDPNADTCNISDKMNNAKAAGAIAGVVYDFFPEDLADFYNYWAYNYNYNLFSNTSLPGAFMTLSDGEALSTQLSGLTGATATLDFNDSPVPLGSDRITFLSSRGPNADFEIKPDMVAVGQNLLTPAETLYSTADFYDPSGLMYPVDGTSGSAPLVAGAAAILKSARPGLTPQQYRSLLVNSASSAKDYYNGRARVMDAGSGVLDINAALNAEAVVAPASLTFGIGDGTTALTQTLTVTNVGSAADSFTLTVQPTDPGFVPQISTNSLQLAPGASANVQVTIPGGVLTAGEYEGAIHVQGNNSATDTHAMYWFGVPSYTPYLINDMLSDQTDPAGQTTQAAIVFRVLDQSGIYIRNPDQLNVTFLGVDSGNGVIRKGTGSVVGTPYNLDSYAPGTIAVDVKLDPRVNYYNVFEVTIGANLTLDFYIQGQ